MTEQKILLSVAIITKNEEERLPDCLKSVSFADDIVVVDSGSADRTLEIAKGFGCRVFMEEWKGYAKQKQTAVDYAEKNWVLILDADERVTLELKKEIIEKIALNSELQAQNFQNPPSPSFVKGGRGGAAGFYVPRKNFFLGRWIKHGGWWPDYTVRLFRKDASYVEEREVHEKVIVKGPVGCLKNPLEHYTYRTISDFIKKMENYSTLSAKEILSKNPQPSSVSLVFKMLVSPVFTFLKMLLIKQGFRDGIRGFMLAILYSFYTFLKYAKAWEKS
ncbi:MAG: glycosyltransferase family 2 protein [Nitrospira bacterium HGW-Nitrospira-1]|nr:MAG: glycosyltransferase family 2 protein [Nitrospira bacterium HGW-Nitrospira-1]